MSTKSEIKSYRDLRVWQAGIDLVERIYEVTKSFPRHELYGLTSQIQRASVSVPSNIAEGHAREHGKEYLHHLSMAQGSLAELETQLEIAKRLAYLSAEAHVELLQKAAAMRMQLYALRNGVARSLTPDTRHPAPSKGGV